MKNTWRKGTLTVTALDYPDPDIIRVEDTYYMVSTTMHFMPGCEILRSYDLVNWEHKELSYMTGWISVARHRLWRMGSISMEKACGRRLCDIIKGFFISAL